jgi:hypothetical protein
MPSIPNNFVAIESREKIQIFGKGGERGEMRVQTAERLVRDCLL